MTVYAAPIEVYRAAFVLVGARLPQSTTEPRPEIEAANAVYEGMVRAALLFSSWRFATKQANLSYQGASGTTPPFAYDIPSDCLEPRWLLFGGERFTDYEIIGGKVLTWLDGREDLQMRYTWRAPESSWDADFSEAIVHMLAGKVAMGPLDRASRGQELFSLGDTQLRAAGARNRSQAPGPQRDPDPRLVAAWRGNNLRPATTLATRNY